MLPYNALRARPNYNDPYGYNMSPYGFSGRGLSGRNSPLSLGSRLGGLAGFGGALGGGLGPISGGLINPLALTQIGIGGIGAIGGLGGLAALGGGYNGINPLALNSLNGIGGNALALGGLGIGGLANRGRMSPILSGAANLPYGNALAALPRTAGFSPNTLPSLSHGRGRGALLGANAQQPHFVYPPMDQTFNIPVYVTSISAQLSGRGAGLGGLGGLALGGLGGRVGGDNPTIFTIPITATVQDVFDELDRSNGQYNQGNVIVTTRAGDNFLLDNLIDHEATVLYNIETVCITLYEA